MKEFIEKLIGRLGEQQAEAENEMHRLRSGDYTLPCSYDITDIKEIVSESFKESIEIVNELAEEYKGGWIPVSERLPEEKPFGDSEHTCSDGVLITVKHDRGTTVGMGCLTRGHWFYLKGTTEIDVIAWKPLPTPYKEEAEKALAEMKGEK